MQRFRQEMGLGRPARTQKSRCQEPHQVKTLDLKSAVARYKRSGVLPDVPVEEVEKAESTGVDKKQLSRLVHEMKLRTSESALAERPAVPQTRKMIQDGLKRGGVEQNPGPFVEAVPPSGMKDCVNCGLRVEGELVFIRQKAILKCKMCTVTLLRRVGKMGDHPPSEAFGALLDEPKESTPRTPDFITYFYHPTLPQEGQVPPRPERPALPSPLASASGAGPSTAPPAEPPQDLAPEPARGGRPSPLATLIAGFLLILQPVFWAIELVKWVESMSYRVVMTGVVPDLRAKDKWQALRGVMLTPTQVFGVLGEASGQTLTRFDICYQHVCEVDYYAERRLACNRNVQEIEAPMMVVELRTPRRSWPRAFACVLGFISLSLTLLLYRSYVPEFSYSLLLPMALTIKLTDIPFYILLLSAALYAYHLDNWFRDGDTVVTFLPHLVSCVLLEYDRGTNYFAAQATIRQKLRRLASLPIPDEDALTLIEGSELVIMYLLGKGDFFGRGAAIMRQPRGQLGQN